MPNLSKPKTTIVTGASQGIGAGITKAFLKRGYNVVANSRKISESEFAPAEKLALVDGNVADPSIAEKIAGTALKKFGSIDSVVNNAGIFMTKPFTDFTGDDFRLLSDTNLYGYFHLTQLAVKQMLAQKTGGSVISITTTLADHPIAGVNASLAMVTKSGLEGITRSLAMEYAKDGIRFNAVAPGIVDTPMHASDPKDFLKSLSPMGVMVEVDDIVDAVLYLNEARYVTGEVLHVDGGAHTGRW